MAGDDVYYKTRGDWWDGYKQHKAVIIDDFYGWLKYDELLKITDRYPYQVPIKGGFENFTSEHIYITSNIDVDRWYKFKEYDSAALKRRMTQYFYCSMDAATQHMAMRDEYTNSVAVHVFDSSPGVVAVDNDISASQATQDNNPPSGR